MFDLHIFFCVAGRARQLNCVTEAFPRSVDGRLRSVCDLTGLKLTTRVVLDVHLPGEQEKMDSSAETCCADAGD